MKKENRLKHIANYFYQNLAGSAFKGVEFEKLGYSADNTFEYYSADLNLCLKIVSENRAGKTCNKNSIMMGYNDSQGVNQIYISEKQILDDVKLVVRQINTLINHTYSDIKVFNKEII